MLIKCNHDRIHAPLDHYTRAGIWEDYSEIIAELSSLVECDDYSIFETSRGYKDVDADYFHAFLQTIFALEDSVKAHASELRKKADYWEERYVYHTENVYAWSLGLKPSVLRAEGIKDWNRGIFTETESPWKEIAAFKSSPEISHEDTLHAINSWREVNRKAS